MDIDFLVKIPSSNNRSLEEWRAEEKGAEPVIYSLTEEKEESLPVERGNASIPPYCDSAGVGDSRAIRITGYARAFN